MLNRFRRVPLFATLWTVAHHVPLSMGFSRQEYWSGSPCPPPGDLPDSGFEPVCLRSPDWQAGSLPLVSPGKPRCKTVLFFQNIVYPGYMRRQETESIQFRLKVWFVIMTLILRRNNAQLGLMKVVTLSRSKDLTDRTLWPPFAHHHCYHSDTNSLIHFAEFKFLERARESSDCFSLSQVCPFGPN